jgi:ATP-dependent DNA helicase RecG
VYALLLAVENGYQAAFMVPTEILAQQHFSTLRDLLKDLELNIELLTSGFKQKIKEKKKEKIRRHKIDVIVGTHSLIQKDVIFKKLGLVIIDEQHKFGVTQREILKTKSSNPDVLIMTATPIPRTLIYTVYGDLDLSVIDKVPPGRLAVKTWWVSEAKRKGAYDFIRKQIRQGRQAFIVYPLIEESEAINLRAAKKMYDKLKNKVFSEFNVGLIHGQLKKQTKEKIMRKFKEGKTDILVSTIVIEVGIDIPNASCLLIEHAERFGLSQLHQLRGRIGRSNFKSYCILVSSSLTESAKKRLSTMACLNDGFKIAEEDLKLRGPGEFLGTRQHGLPEIRIGDIITDSKILKKARRQAFELIKDDPDLEKDKHQALKSYLHSKMQTE